MSSAMNCNEWTVNTIYTEKNTSPNPTIEISASSVDTLRPKQNGRHHADDIFKRISVNKKYELSEPVIDYFTNEYMRYPTSMREEYLFLNNRTCTWLHLKVE